MHRLRKILFLCLGTLALYNVSNYSLNEQNAGMNAREDEHSSYCAKLNEREIL